MTQRCTYLVGAIAILFSLHTAWMVSLFTAALCSDDSWAVRGIVIFAGLLHVAAPIVGIVLARCANDRAGWAIVCVSLLLSLGMELLASLPGDSEPPVRCEAVPGLLRPGGLRLEGRVPEEHEPVERAS